MKVTKEDVEKARAAADVAAKAARPAIDKAYAVYCAARTAARADEKVAWSKYFKLKREYENESN